VGDTSTQPDLNVVRRSYQGFRARLYDIIVRPVSVGYRAQAVERLELRPGETVIDLGCGTGLSLPLLAPMVGEQGRVIGLDASPDMLALSRRRVEAVGRRNVELVEAFAHQFRPEIPVDAVLACNVNQLIASREVMEQALSWLRPGGRIVAAGGKGGRGLGGLVPARAHRRQVDPPPATMVRAGRAAAVAGDLDLARRHDVHRPRGQG
jgi:SAM-dependent methyltransferase